MAGSDIIETGLEYLRVQPDHVRVLAQRAIDTSLDRHSSCSCARVLSVHFARKGETVLSLYWSAIAAELA